MTSVDNVEPQVQPIVWRDQEDENVFHFGFIPLVLTSVTTLDVAEDGCHRCFSICRADLEVLFGREWVRRLDRFLSAEEGPLNFSFYILIADELNVSTDTKLSG